MSTPLPPHLDPRGRHRGRSGGARAATTGNRALRPLGQVLGALLSVGLLVFAGYTWYQFREVNKKVPRRPIAVGAAPTDTKQDIDGKDQNILVIGNDDRTNMTNAEVKELRVGRDGGSLATDTMMIVHVPANGRKATLISLPRDSYVKIPGHGMARLNSAYADGYTATKGDLSAKQTAGANLLVQTITNLTGLTINHYTQVSLLGFVRISNAVGGVPVNLCHAVNDTVAHNKAEGSDGGSGLVLAKGKHTIKGVQALEFVRQRHNLPNGDLDRIKRQQYFLTAAFRQVASVGVLTKFHAIGNAIQSSVFVDDGLDLLGLAQQLENLTANNIVGKTIPTTPATINGQSVLQIKPAKVRTFIDSVINPPKPTTPAPSTSRTAPAGSASTSTTPPAIDSKCIN